MKNKADKTDAWMPLPIVSVVWREADPTMRPAKRRAR